MVDSLVDAPVLLVLGELAVSDSARAQDGQKQTLVLYATRRDAQIAVVGERELPQILEQGLGAGLDYYSEYIDRARFPDPAYKAAFRDFLRLKYQGHRFDVVVALQESSLEFIGEQRNDLFPDTPVVFFGGSEVGRLADSTGVISDLDFRGTLELAVTLQPDTKQVFVVTGADPTDREYESLARQQFRPFDSRVSFTFLTGLPTDDLKARLASLPQHSIIYYLLANRDGMDKVVHPLEYLEELTAVANAPIYSWVDSALVHGIVGGHLKSQTEEMRAIGQLALRVLRGEPADSIPLITKDLHVSQVDWRQLRRWGISEARVPAGTVVLFREPSAWDRYSVYILGAAGAILAQTVLIVGLLIQRTRRRQAEVQVRTSQAALRSSYERIRYLGGRLLHAQEAERSRIARELHDDISQQMALLKIDIELLGSAEGYSEKLADEALNRAQEVAKSVHDLSRRLHPARLSLLGLVAALNGLRNELSKSDVAITFTHQNVPSTLSPDLTLCLFRVAQEALQNAMKHSQAREITVALRGDAEVLSLTIADDGVGFDVNAVSGKGLGLISMAERLDVHGGTIAIRSTPGAGTRLEIAVPLRAMQAVRRAESA